MTSDATRNKGGRHTLADLLAVMAALRTPGSGCPWDLEQTFSTIAPYTIEEAYEVADAIERGDLADLKEELGDLLFQSVYHARMAEEAGAFEFGDVVDTVTAKMLRRHPHVFGTAAERAAGASPGFWERNKVAEKAAKADERRALGLPEPPARSLLDDVPAAMPGLSRAVKLQDKAAAVGFDWPSLAPVFDKLAEEIEELKEVALAADPRGDRRSTFVAAGDRSLVAPGDSPSSSRPPGADAASGRRAERVSDAAIQDELGDVLFVIANIARHLGVDPESALRGANAKFTRRFRHIEARLAEIGKTPADSTLEEMDGLWNEVRVREKG